MKNLVEENILKARIKATDKIKKEEGGKKEDTVRQIEASHKYDGEEQDEGEQLILGL